MSYSPGWFSCLDGHPRPKLERRVRVVRLSTHALEVEFNAHVYWKTRALALIAPVPEKHLLTALEAIDQQYDDGEEAPIIAFGISDFEVFRQADQLRGNRAIEVCIYASMSEQEQPLNPRVSWRGLYVGHVPSHSGRYPGKASHRPSSTKGDKPIWVVYWQVQELARLDTLIQIGMFQGFKQKKIYEKCFVPKGQLLVEYP